MSTNTIRGRLAPNIFTHLRLQRGMAFGVIILTALFAFELFNYGTTDYALGDLLGELDFLGVRWATILAIAFCSIDFAGIARLFTPEKGAQEPNEVWYLFGAWLLAATMNAMLTWWGVTLAILNHQALGNAVISRETMLRVVPIFVALLVWLIRVLIIGTFSAAGDRLFSMDERRPQPGMRSYQQAHASSQPGAAAQANASPLPARSMSGRPQGSRLYPRNDPGHHPTPKTAGQEEATGSRPEPSYQSISMRGSPSDRSSSGRLNSTRR